MKRVTIAMLSVLVAAASVFGQQHPNLTKGFNATGVYQFNGLDSVNAFNGNLNVAIPLGQTYTVSPGLSYRFSLVWNNNQWLSRQEGSTYIDCCTLAYPSHRSNAGFGWILSLGRLYPASNLEGTGDWTYESPDGADHQFFDELHPENDGASGSPTPPNDPVSYTRDGSYIRMQLNVATNRRIVELPDGTVYTFAAPPNNEGPWRLEQITDGYSANFVNVVYDDVALTWTVSDSRGRQHKVFFQDVPGYDDGGRQIVDRLELASFGGTTAHYDLTYLQNPSSSRPYWHDPEHHDTTVPRRANLWFLASVRGGASLTVPNSSDALYSFTYDQAVSEGFHPGQLLQMKLPTGGTVAWELGQYPLPIQDQLHVYQESFGVIARKVYARGVVPGSDNQISTIAYKLTTRCDPITLPTPCVARDSITTIRNYNGTYDPFNLSSPAPVSRSEHYFSVSPVDYGVWSAAEYGKPFTHMVSNGGAGLSQRQFAGTSTDPLKSTYLRYDCDRFFFPLHSPPDWRCVGNSRLDLSRVVHADAHWMQTAYTDFDGYGHYRNAIVSSSLPNTPERATVVNYNPGRGSYPSYPNNFVMIPTNEPWRTGLAAYTMTAGSGKTFTSEMTFDQKGFLLRKRSIQDTETGARGTKDVIAVYTPDARGSVSTEEHYGGDSGNVGLQNLATASLGSRLSRFEHSESAGTNGNWNERSKFFGLDTWFRDVTIDRNTGLVAESRDTAVVPTGYVYDFMGRMTREKPTGRAWTVAKYVTSGSSEIGIEHFPNGAETGTALTSARHEIDGLGRVTREATMMPGGTESYRDTGYDGLGRRTSVSELGSPSATTTFAYDALGRPLTVTAPDGGVTTHSYTGDRVKTRTSSIATPLTATKSVTTTEEYDGYGRLIAVTEPSGTTTAAQPNGGDVRTEYVYDAADHLVTVKMNALQTPVQHRFFEYDGRGFLRWESQPENGLTSYEYDARGNVLTRRRTGDSGIDVVELVHTYDTAGRLSRIDVPNPEYDAGDPETFPYHPIKEFVYGTANEVSTPGGLTNLAKGKLTYAFRYNYHQIGRGYKVSHRYRYLDAAGRRVSRDTVIAKLDDTELKSIDVWTDYDDLDLTVKVWYPMCYGCGYSPNVVRNNEVRTYDRGRLTSLTGFLSGVTYWPNGLRHVMPHANGVADTQAVGTMARPASIAFGQYDRCVKPKFDQQPGGASVSTSQPSTTLSAVASGTAVINYDWYRIDEINGEPIDGFNDIFGTWIASGPTFPVSPTVTTEYAVKATNDCGETLSHRVKVTVASCAMPEIKSIAPVVQPDRSWILTPDLRVRTQSLAFEWRRLDTNAIIATTETAPVGALSRTTTFSLKVTDVCGTITANVTIVVPLSMTTTAFTATANANRTAITLVWPSVTDATSYSVWRRWGGTWENIATPAGTATSYVDSNVVAGRVYAYNVSATGAYSSSNTSNTDMASTASLTPVIAGQLATSGGANTMLSAVNLVREAAGWPALGWSTILSPTDPVVAIGNVITARQLLACQARMNEVLVALGAKGALFTDPGTAQGYVKAIQVMEVQGAIE